MVTFSGAWKNHNKPQRVIKDGFSYYPIPLLAPILDLNEDNIDNFLPSPESYGWEDSMTNYFAWANNYDKIIYLELDFDRFGYLPKWFPIVDSEQNPLSPQEQVNRFLFLADQAYTGFPDAEEDIPLSELIKAIIELHDNYYQYVEIEESERFPWKEWE